LNRQEREEREERFRFCHPEPQRRISHSWTRDPSLRLRMTNRRLWPSE